MIFPDLIKLGIIQLAPLIIKSILIPVLAALIKIAPQMDADKIDVMNMFGRGDKDINTVAEIDGIKI